jgi:hypothetical protein
MPDDSDHPKKKSRRGFASMALSSDVLSPRFPDDTRLPDRLYGSICCSRSCLRNATLHSPII